MEKFVQTEHDIFQLPIKDRICFCKKMVREMTGRKLSWQEAKQYYHEMFDCDTYQNDIYSVMVFRNKKADWQVHEKSWKGNMTYISIKRKDKKAVHDWRHFQQIKNELVGDEVEAIELYPKESRLHDTVNQYHLFCLPLGTTFKFGWQERNVDYTPREGGYNKAGQRAKD